MYLEGLGVPKDVKKAMELIKECAEQNEPYAQLDLGMIYLDGVSDGVTKIERDVPLALKWIRKSASALNAGAMLQLGVMYGTGLGYANIISEGDNR